jgi:hypothetical protein
MLKQAGKLGEGGRGERGERKEDGKTKDRGRRVRGRWKTGDGEWRREEGGWRMEEAGRRRTEEEQKYFTHTCRKNKNRSKKNSCDFPRKGKFCYRPNLGYARFFLK